LGVEEKIMEEETGDPGLLHPTIAVHHAADSILQMDDIEIDQQAHSHSAEAQVGK